MSIAKTWASINGVRQAIERRGFQLMAFDYVEKDGRHTAHFWTHTAQDRDYIREHGFEASIDPERAAP